MAMFDAPIFSFRLSPCIVSQAFQSNDSAEINFEREMPLPLHTFRFFFTFLQSAAFLAHGKGGFRFGPSLFPPFSPPNPFWRLQRRLWDAEALVLVRAARTADGGFPSCWAATSSTGSGISESCSGEKHVPRLRGEFRMCRSAVRRRPDIGVFWSRDFKALF